MDITQDELLTTVLEGIGEAVKEILDDRLAPIEQRLSETEEVTKSTNNSLSKIVGARKSLDDSQEPAPIDDQRDAWGRRIRSRT